MTNDKDIIAALRDKAEKHKGLYDIYSKAADQLQEELGISISDKEDLSPLEKDKPTLKRTKFSNHTFRDVIIRIFDSNMPFTAKQLQEEYTELTGKHLKYSAFSSQLSTFKKDSKLLRMYENKENPISSRYIYGLSQWFEGDKLKKEYLDKFNLE